ncbi:ankyrin repeat-containing domain protein [Aspergillus granulosus]|uniref:Ankyrin repeat-containing domain protein n=1 Tax=Aspergillus granulosus TaxID=176169 RepID=A0ABR4HEX7_9EURO
MSSFDLFELPEELVLQIVEHLPASDLASFIKTSKISWRIAIRTVEKYPAKEILTQFKEVTFTDNSEQMLSLLPILRRLHKADPRIGYEALILSCMGSCSEAVWLLINDGVPYSPLDRLRREGITEQYECTPLLYAMHNPHPAPLQVIIDFIANGDQRTNHCPGATCDPSPHAQEALDWAIRCKNMAMVEHLLAERHVDVNYSYANHCPALLTAAKRGSPFIVHLLLQHKADVHARDPINGWTAVHYAAAKGHTLVVEMLLEAGANVGNVEQRLGHTPLLLAAGHGQLETVQVLLDRGAHINHRNKLGRSALSIAAAIGYWEIVNVLIEGGADIRQVCCKGRTALSYAIGRNNRLAAYSLANAASVHVFEAAYGRGRLDYTTRGFYRRQIDAGACGHHDRDAGILELAGIIGYPLSGDAEADAHGIKCEFAAFVDFDLCNGPVSSEEEWYDEDEDITDPDEVGRSS